MTTPGRRPGPPATGGADDEKERWPGSGTSRACRNLLPLTSSIRNHFNQERHLSNRENFKLNRSAALAEWRPAAASAEGSLRVLDCWFYWSDQVSLTMPYGSICGRVLRTRCEPYGTYGHPVDNAEGCGRQGDSAVSARETRVAGAS